MIMSDIDFENFLRYLETENILPQPLIEEEENQVLRQNGGVTPQEQAALVAVDVTPLTAAVPPPNAVVMSTPAQRCKPAAAERRRARAADKEKKAKSTAAHTLSERKRRGKINERIKALQELIPNASKLDKASMFDEATEYLKSAELLLKRMQDEYMQEMGIDPTMVSYTGAMQQVAYYNPLLMAQAAKLVGPMWDPQLITPGLYPFHQVQLPNSDHQFYGMQQNDQNL